MTRINGRSIYIRAFKTDDAEELLALQLTNRDFFERFSTHRDNDFYTLEGQKTRIKSYAKSWELDQQYMFGIFTLDKDALIGTVNLFEVLRGSLQGAFIGYFLDQKQNGKGYMTEAVKLVVAYAFEHLKLHRIEAGVMPHNIGSIRVLEKAGFHKEGIAVKNVKINGRWEDHQMLARINPND
ncbi:GNAT family N-acetyltransferase [Oceanobacillus chungangensis]|uniref:RimJ/RimL family protein N-acetyltransferase n=1 Tax=Oceanobacillus chungangensis TaxID=1229152 RepID=A0A3D8PNE0_9BACI|nr:GNAT family protein [Oceanobacillus chungangensis]RDW16758.1 RimJ/RimL family protein N-acetyltransferase [Oceanobacillus chungangensis]